MTTTVLAIVGLDDNTALSRAMLPLLLRRKRKKMALMTTAGRRKRKKMALMTTAGGAIVRLGDNNLAGRGLHNSE